MPRTEGGTRPRAGMNTNTLAIVVVGAVVVVVAVAGGVVLLLRRSARGRAEGELMRPVPPPWDPASDPAPQASSGAPGGGFVPPIPPPANPAPQAGSEEPGAEFAPPDHAPSNSAPPPPPPAGGGAPVGGELPVLVSQPENPGGWTSILRAHAEREAPGTITPDAVDVRDPAELAQAAAAAEAEAGEGEPGEALSPAEDTPSELVMASSPDPSRLRLLGLVLGLLTERTRQEQPPQLGTALARLGDGDQEQARAQLSTLSLTLMGEDQLNEEGEQQLSEFLSDVLGGEMANGFGFSTMPEFQQALNAVTPELRHRLDTIVWSRNADAINILTAEDVEVLERVAVAMTAALILDTTYGGRRPEEDGESGDGGGHEPDETPHDTTEGEAPKEE